MLQNLRELLQQLQYELNLFLDENILCLVVGIGDCET
jgi:hypothetical protein